MMFTKLFRPKAWDRSETTTEPVESTATANTILHAAVPTVKSEDVQALGGVPPTSLIITAGMSESSPLNKYVRTIAPEQSAQIALEEGLTTSTQIEIARRQQGERLRKETEERTWKEDEEKVRLQKEKKRLRMEKERLWKEEEERLKKEQDERLCKAKEQGMSSDVIAPTNSSQDGTGMDVASRKAPSGSPWLGELNVMNGFPPPVISTESEEARTNRITRENAKKERTRVEAEEKAKKDAEEHGPREEDERVAAAKKREDEKNDCPVRIQEEARFHKEAEENKRIRSATEESARKAAEAEAKRQQQLKEERLRKEEEDKERIRLEAEEERLRKVAEEQARKVAEAEAKRERELKEERLRKEEEEKERIRLATEKERLRKLAEEHAIKVAEAEAKRAQKLEEERLRKEEEGKERMRLAEKERLRKLAEEQARKVAEVEARRVQKLEEERLRNEKEQKERLRLEVLENERLRKVADENARKAAEAQAKREQDEQTRNLEQERIRQEKEKERVRELEEKAKKTAAEEAEQIKNGQEKDRKQGLRIETANLRRKQHGPLDMFYVSGNDSIPASLPSALASAHIIDDIDNIICPDGMNTPKAAEHNFNAEDGQLKNDRDFLFQFMRHLTRSTVAAPPNSPAEEEHAAIHFDSSHQTNPIEWTRVNREHVATITRLLFDQKSVTTACDVNKVYPRLTLYTLACIMFNSIFPEDTKRAKFSDALNVLENWNSWDDIGALAQHQTIRNYLLSCLKSINEMHATRDDDSDGIHLGITLDHVLKMDANAIDALLLQTLQNRVKYQDLVARRGQEAQSLLNLLQARLGFPLDPSLKRFHTGALIKLSRTSGLYPECMILKGTKLVGKTALDAGSFGDIWKGLLGGQEICIKVLKVFQKSDKVKLLKDFSSEAVIWRQLNHPNVLPFYGVFRLEDERLCLASPWMNNGNVVRFLETAPETNRLPLISDIGEGLNYLHMLKPSIIHGDLKGVNILITQSHRACLADFGLATAKDSKSFAVKSGASVRATGTLRWQAPELLDPDADDASCENTLASDVYAYACVCYEIYSGELPFYGIKNDFRVMAAVMKGTRPSRPSRNTCRIRGLNDEIWSIIESCWADEPTDRLATHQIVECLRLLSPLNMDERPFDTFDSSFPSRTLYSQAEHPFSALLGTTDAAK